MSHAHSNNPTAPSVGAPSEQQAQRERCALATGSGVGLTPCEKQVLEHLALAWNVFVSIETYHPDETEEMRRAIHAAQHIVATRVAYRANPEIWCGRTYPNKADHTTCNL